MKISRLEFLLNSKSVLLKKIYYFYNIYIRNFKFLFNGSQFGESKKILKHFKNKYKGKYVDLGCFHPTRHNNTIELYRKNWKGINVDLSSTTIDLFNFHRPNDINIKCAVSSKNAIRTYYFKDKISPLNTLEKSQLSFLKKKFNIQKNDLKKLKIKTQTLKQILKRYKFFNIDFLNIDIEGHELKVLQNFNFKLFKIHLICLEMLKNNKKSIVNSLKIDNILKKNGFKFVEKIGVNHFYKNKKFD
jgi:FkbM family methyltransferase